MSLSLLVGAIYSGDLYRALLPATSCRTNLQYLVILDCKIVFQPSFPYPELDSFWVKSVESLISYSGVCSLSWLYNLLMVSSTNIRIFCLTEKLLCCGALRELLLLSHGMFGGSESYYLSGRVLFTPGYLAWALCPPCTCLKCPLWRRVHVQLCQPYFLLLPLPFSGLTSLLTGPCPLALWSTVAKGFLQGSLSTPFKMLSWTRPGLHHQCTF